MISGIFTKCLIENEILGVLYPNVREERKGFKLALKYSILDECLTLKSSKPYKIINENNRIEINEYSNF